MCRTFLREGRINLRAQVGARCCVIIDEKRMVHRAEFEQGSQKQDHHTVRRQSLNEFSVHFKFTLYKYATETQMWFEDSEIQKNLNGMYVGKKMG